MLGDEYGWFERGDRVRDLQQVLGLSVDGVYGPATRAVHLAEIEEWGLAADGIPPIPTTTTTTTTEAPVDEEAVLLASYGWNERGAGVRVLQGVLGIGVDGHYGPATRAAHLAEIEERGLVAAGVPAVPTTTEVPTRTEVPTTPAPVAFGGMGAEIVAQLLGQPCIADGDLSDCPPSVIDLVSGLTG